MAPQGWHVPNLEEWEELLSYLGGKSVAGGKLKARGLMYWRYPNSGATDEFGFTALPAGFRNYYSGVCIGLYNGIEFWSTTETDHSRVVAWLLDYSTGEIRKYNERKNTGLPIRFVRD